MYSIDDFIYLVARGLEGAARLHRQLSGLGRPRAEPHELQVGCVGRLEADDVVVLLEGLAVDDRVELDVLVADPLIRRTLQDVVAADHLQPHASEVVHAELDIGHFCKVGPQ